MNDVTIGNQQELRSFIGGLFDAEGWFTKHRDFHKDYQKEYWNDTFGFVNTNPQIVKFYLDFLRSIQCGFSIVRRRRKKHYKIQYQVISEGNKQTRRFRENIFSVKAGNWRLSPYWLLGFLDGDGSVGISKKAKRKSFVLIPSIRFFNTNKEIIERCKSILDSEKIGYCISSSKKGRKEEKITIVITGLKRCDKFLKSLPVTQCFKGLHLSLLRNFIESRKMKRPKIPYSEEEILTYERLKFLND